MPTEDPDEKQLGLIFPLTFSGVSTMDLFGAEDSDHGVVIGAYRVQLKYL